MKKMYVAVFAFAAVSISKPAIGQNGYSLSVIGTPQFSFLQNSNDHDNSKINRDASFRASFGVGAVYHFTASTGLGVDVLYSLQGQRYEINGKDSTKKLNYLKVPVYFQYLSKGTGAVSFLGKIGPQVSVLTAAKVTDGGDKKLIANTKSWYNNVTFGGMAGAGAQWRLNPKWFLSALARFDYDFTDAEDKKNKHWHAGREKTHNYTTGLEVALKYKLD